MTPSGPEQPLNGSANRIDSFRHAFAGWAELLRATPNARIHLAFGLGVVGLGLWLGISRLEWAILWAMIGLVFASEFANSALEAAVNLASPDLHPLAKSAKDMAAGGVLFAACSAAVVGLLILGPPLVARLFPELRSLFY